MILRRVMKVGLRETHSVQLRLQESCFNWIGGLGNGMETIGAKTPQAELCDFGKYCETPTATNTVLANWLFLPPELKEGHQKLYNQKLDIDIWMLGLPHHYQKQQSLQPPRPTHVNVFTVAPVLAEYSSSISPSP